MEGFACQGTTYDSPSRIRKSHCPAGDLAPMSAIGPSGQWASAPHMSAHDPKRRHWTWVQLDLAREYWSLSLHDPWQPIAAQRPSHGEKRQVKKSSVASAPCSPRTTSRGLRYLLASESKRSDVSDRGRRPGSEDRLVFPAAQRWGPN